MAFSNLSVAFGVKSEDAREDISVLDETLQSIDNKLGDIKGMEAFSGLIESLNLNVLDDLKGKLDGIGDELGGNVELSGKLDSVFAEANKSMQKLSASANLSQEEMSRFRQETSFFESLQMDAEEVQQTWLRLHDAGLDVSNLGFKNLQEFMKFTEVSGVEGPRFVKMLEMMTKQFDMTGEQARGLVDDVLQVGRTFDVGSEFIQKMPEHIQKAQKHFSQLRHVSEEDIPGLTRGTFQLAGALEDMGFEADKSMEMATQTFENLGEQGLDMQKVMSGVSDSIDKGVKTNLMALGDMSPGQNPVEYIRRLQKAYQEGGTMIRQRIREQIPDAMEATLEQGSKLESRLQKGAKAMKNSAGAANELAEAHRTTRTTQERYDRQQMLFNQHIRDMSRNLGVTGDLLEQQGNAFDMIEGKLNKYVNLGKEGQKVTNMFGMKLQDAEGNMTGMGKATKAATEAFIGYKTAGLRGATIAVMNLAEKHGLLSDQLSKNKEAFSGMLTMVLQGLPEIMTMIATMNVAGIGGMGFLGPLMPAAIIGGGLVALEQTWEGGITGFLGDMEGLLKEKVPELRKQLSTWFNQSMDAMPGVLSKAGDLIEPLTTGIVNLIDQIDWGQVGSMFATGIGRALEFVGTDIVPPALSMLMDVTSGVFDALTDWMTDPGSSVWDKMKTAGAGLLGAVGVGFATAPGTTFNVLKSGVKGLKGASLKGVASKMGIISASVVGVTSAVETLQLATTAWQGDVEETEKVAESSFMSILDSVDALSLGIISSLGSSLGITRGHVKAFYHFMVGQLSKTIDWIATSFSLIPEITSYVWNVIQTKFNQMMAGIVQKAAEGFKAIRKPVQSFVGFLKLSFANISMIVKTIATTMLQPFQTVFVELVSFLKTAVNVIHSIAKEIPGVGSLSSGMVEAVRSVKTDDLKFADKMGLTLEARKRQAQQLKEMNQTVAKGSYGDLSDARPGEAMDDWAQGWREAAKAQGKEAGQAGRKINKAIEGVRERSKMADREMQEKMGEAVTSGVKEQAEDEESKQRDKQRAKPKVGDVKVEQPAPPSKRGGGQTDVGMATAAINRDGFRTMSQKLDRLVNLMKRGVEQRGATPPERGQSGNVSFTH